MDGDAPDYHIFEVSPDDGGQAVCMDLAHFYITDSQFTVGTSRPRGTRIGRIAPYTYTEPHYHIGLWRVPKGTGWATSDFSLRTAQKFTGAYQLDGKDYEDLAGTNDWYGTSVVSTNGSVATVKPTDLKATAISSSQIRLNWTDGATNETGYIIDRWDGSQWAKIALTGANTTSYTDSGLQANTTHFYLVGSYNDAGISWAANWVSAKTEGPSLPAKPTNLTAWEIYNRTIRFWWSYSGPTVDNFKVYRWNGSAWDQIAQVPGSQGYYHDAGRQPDTTYCYTVCASNSAGTTCADGYATITTARAAEGQSDAASL